jgi:hypothetical protein
VAAAGQPQKSATVLGTAALLRSIDGGEDQLPFAVFDRKVAQLVEPSLKIGTLGNRKARWLKTKSATVMPVASAVKLPSKPNVVSALMLPGAERVAKPRNLRRIVLNEHS